VGANGGERSRVTIDRKAEGQDMISLASGQPIAERPGTRRRGARIGHPRLQLETARPADVRQGQVRLEQKGALEALVGAGVGAGGVPARRGVGGRQRVAKLHTHIPSNKLQRVGSAVA
jgi:hypothetical protein